MSIALSRKFWKTQSETERDEFTLDIDMLKYIFAVLCFPSKRVHHKFRRGVHFLIAFA